MSLPASAQEESQSWRTRCSTDSKCSSSLSSSSSSASFHSAAGWFSRRDLKKTEIMINLTCTFGLQCRAAPTDGANAWSRGERELVHGEYCSVSMWAEQEQPNGCARRLAPSYAAIPLQASTLHIKLDQSVNSCLILNIGKSVKCDNVIMKCNIWCLVRCIPDSPPTSIFFRFLASRIQMVSLPAVGT